MRRPRIGPALLSAAILGPASGCSSVLGLASGCSSVLAETDRPPREAGPTVTSTVAPDPAVTLAERYRRDGGLEDVYGSRHAPGPDGVPLFTVWTRDPDDGSQPFERLRRSVTAFMRHKEGLSLSRGYLMDVFGPDGTLQHRLDARL
ncbi:hypothetical protein [Streptomyces sp. JJ38]|uniref:hypothetical protein n=1 Tax=Streptomyces sp. JJ38 TaxID=2738128 RepID=UPI001C575C78|nr:hypothetical protein [Streptomyces sp. JJ38]MBW1597810.1 hypothetical protein [Streptomyces sp. JJ38]